MTQRRPIPRRKNKNRDTEAGRRLLGWIWSLPSGALAVMAAAITVYTYVPHLSLQRADTVRAHDPMGTMFDLTNQGITTIYNVSAKCMQGEINMSPGPVFTENDFGSIELAEQLPYEGTVTIPCDRQIGNFGQVRSAKMKIVISYRPLLYWGTRNKTFVWEAQRKEDGGWFWRETAG